MGLENVAGVVDTEIHMERDVIRNRLLHLEELDCSQRPNSKAILKLLQDTDCVVGSLVLRATGGSHRRLIL